MRFYFSAHKKNGKWYWKLYSSDKNLLGTFLTWLDAKSEAKYLAGDRGATFYDLDEE